jgi:hypothetical protein
MVAMNELATICSLTTDDAQPPAESGSALPVGWARMSPRCSSGASHEGGHTGSGHENAEPVLLAPQDDFSQSSLSSSSCSSRRPL